MIKKFFISFNVCTLIFGAGFAGFYIRGRITPPTAVTSPLLSITIEKHIASINADPEMRATVSLILCQIKLLRGLLPENVDTADDLLTDSVQLLEESYSQGKSKNLMSELLVYSERLAENAYANRNLKLALRHYETICSIREAIATHKDAKIIEKTVEDKLELVTLTRALIKLATIKRELRFAATQYRPLMDRAVTVMQAQTEQLLEPVDPTEENLRILSQTSDCIESIGDMFNAEEVFEKAENLYVNSQKMRRTLIDIQPLSFQFQRDFAGSYERIGDCYIKKNKIQDAIKAYKMCLELRSNLVVNPSTVEECAWLKGVGQLRLGNAYAMEGNPDSIAKSIDCLQRACNELEGALFNANRLDRKLDLAHTKVCLGTCLFIQNKKQAAAKQFKDARDILSFRQKENIAVKWHELPDPWLSIVYGSSVCGLRAAEHVPSTVLDVKTIEQEINTIEANMQLVPMPFCFYRSLIDQVKKMVHRE